MDWGHWALVQPCRNMPALAVAGDAVSCEGSCRHTRADSSSTRAELAEVGGVNWAIEKSATLLEVCYGDKGVRGGGKEP